MTRPTPRRTTGVATFLATTVALLGGCGFVGGDGIEAYCGDLEEAQAQFAGLGAEGGGDAPDAEELEASVATFRELGEAAPEEVAGPWRVVVDNLDEREAVLDGAGLTWADLAGAADEPPEGTSADELAQVGERLSALNTDEFTEANDAITAHAESECGLEPPTASGGGSQG